MKCENKFRPPAYIQLATVKFLYSLSFLVSWSCAQITPVDWLWRPICYTTSFHHKMSLMSMMSGVRPSRWHTHCDSRDAANRHFGQTMKRTDIFVNVKCHYNQCILNNNNNNIKSGQSNVTKGRMAPHSKIVNCEILCIIFRCRQSN